MTITAQTPWRHLGAVPFAVWQRRITDAGGTAAVARFPVWLALGDDSALALAMLGRESSYASDYDAIPEAKRNPWNLQIAGVGLTFASYVEAAEAWRSRLYDPRYKQGIYTRTVTIADLIGVYAPASDGNDTEGYIRKLVADINRNGFDPPVTTPSTPAEPAEQEPAMSTYNYDNGVEPPWVDVLVAESRKFAGYIDPTQHFIAACVIHSAYGGLEGTTGWFKGGNALTDTMVGNSFDGAALDGQIRRFNDAYGPRYSWSSGPVNNPIEDAAKFLEIFGPNPEVVNMYTTAMERSCAAVTATNPVTEKEHAARCAWIAWHANRYGKRVKERTGKDGFTCDTFPLIPGENNRSFLIYHGEISAGKRQTCPDPYVRQTIDRMIADVRTILAGWQKGASTIPPQVPPDQMPEYAKPLVVPELQAYTSEDTAPAFTIVNGQTFIFVSDRVRATEEIPRRRTAEMDAPVIGPPIEKGLEFAVNWLVWASDGNPWYLTPFWTRVPAAATQRIQDKAQ